MNNLLVEKELDLHGEYRGSAEVLTKEFLNDCIDLKMKKVAIVHGRSGGVLKSVVHEILKKDKRVKSFKVDFFNTGCTIVEFK